MEASTLLIQRIIKINHSSNSLSETNLAIKNNASSEYNLVVPIKQMSILCFNNGTDRYKTSLQVVLNTAEGVIYQ